MEYECFRQREEQSKGMDKSGVGCQGLNIPCTRSLSGHFLDLREGSRFRSLL